MGRDVSRTNLVSYHATHYMTPPNEAFQRTGLLPTAQFRRYGHGGQPLDRSLRHRGNTAAIQAVSPMVRLTPGAHPGVQPLQVPRCSLSLCEIGRHNAGRRLSGSAVDARVDLS